MPALRILIVEDSEDDAALLLRELRRGGYDPIHVRVDTADSMKKALDQKEWEIVLSDYSMPNFTGLDALRLLQKSGRDIPFIILSGTIGDEVAVEAMKAGAHDYLLKNNLTRLIPAIRRELREAVVRRERVKAQEMILYLAYHDPLTSLSNRTGFELRLKDLIKANSVEKRPFALLLMNLERFKAINNTLGHHHGNGLLSQVGERLNEIFKSSEKIARLGGDEFSVLLQACDLRGAVRAAGAILESFEKPFLLETMSLYVRASVGISVFPGHGEDPILLMQHADVAMCAAKEARSGYAVYNAEQDQNSPRLLMLMSDLPRAIHENELFLVFQPTIDIRSGQAIGFEALLRWKHPKLGNIPPDQFIPIAENMGLMKPLTLWVANEAIRQLHSWRKAGLDLPIAINVSTQNLLDPEFPDQVAGLFSTWGVSPEFLDMEVTESAIMVNAQIVIETARRLSEMGIRVAIDDFGTGYSSLAYLKRLSVSSIKIDKTFIKDMITDQDDQEIVRSTIELAHNLKLAVVAEGVETKEMWDRLLALGCDTAQGYYMRSPIPATEVPGWLKESPWGAPDPPSPE